MKQKEGNGEYPNRVLAMLSRLKGEPVVNTAMVELLANNLDLRLQLIRQMSDALDLLESATLREMELRDDRRFGKPIT